MPQNWPPVGGPAWPNIQASSLDGLIALLRRQGWTDASPTNTERQNFFDPARCDLGHGVTGRMAVSPQGVRYPFAVCDTNHSVSAGTKSRAFFFLWEPFYENSFTF